MEIKTPAHDPLDIDNNGKLPYPLHLVPEGLSDSHLNKLTLLVGPYKAKWDSLAEKLAAYGYDVINPSGASSVQELHDIYEQNKAAGQIPISQRMDNPFVGDPMSDQDFYTFCNYEIGDLGDGTPGLVLTPRWAFLTIQHLETETDTAPDGTEFDVPVMQPTDLPAKDTTLRLNLEVTNYVVRRIYQSHIAMSIIKTGTMGVFGGRPRKIA